MSRDLELGLEFPGINYFDGQGFLVPALFGARSPLQLDGDKICVISGTTSESNAAAFFRKSNLKVTFLGFAERSAARAAYAAGKCDVFTGDRSALAAERSLLSTPQDHIILRDVISKEPLGPATRKDDPKWTGLVRWTLCALINAEELALSSRSVVTSHRQLAVALAAPAARALGLSGDWLINVIAGVGNYAEMFERNLGRDTRVRKGSAGSSDFRGLVSIRPQAQVQQNTRPPVREVRTRPANRSAAVNGPPRTEKPAGRFPSPCRREPYISSLPPQLSRHDGQYELLNQGHQESQGRITARE